MNVYLYVSATFFIAWTYFCIATVTQQHAKIGYFDEQYLVSARAFTRRRARGDAYLTNITIVTRVPFDNNASAKVVADIKSIGSIVFHEMATCDAYKVPWINQMRKTYTNFTECPIAVGTYEVFNLEVPPRSYPLPVPKGEGTLHLYVYLTKNKHIILHAYVNIISF